MEVANMSVNKIAAMLVSELIRSEKVIDQNAETINEICAATGVKRSVAERSVSEKIKAGLIEQVWKQSNGRILKAYRLKNEKAALKKGKAGR